MYLWPAQLGHKQTWNLAQNIDQFIQENKFQYGCCSCSCFMAVDFVSIVENNLLTIYCIQMASFPRCN